MTRNSYESRQMLQYLLREEFSPIHPPPPLAPADTHPSSRFHLDARDVRGTHVTDTYTADYTYVPRLHAR